MRPFLPAALIATLLAIAIPPVHADLPDLGDVSAASMSGADEVQIGRDAFRAMRESELVIDDVEVSAYLNQIGHKLSADAQMPGMQFTYFAVDDNGINAFAMPGGYIGVNRGLVLATQSEAELASVLGHETAHVTQHHMARMKAASAPNQLLVLAAIAAAALAAGTGNGNASFGAINAGIGLSLSNQLSYSRDFEREADRVGMQYLADAGFDARAMPAFFERLQSANRYNDNNALAFLRTHPVTIERISEGQDRAANYPVKMRADSTDYVLVREKLRTEQLPPDEAIRHYQISLANRQFLNEGAQYYGLARAKLAAHDVTGARAAIRQAQKLLPDNAMLVSLDAEIARTAGDTAGALARYRQGLANYPSARTLIYGELDTLIAAGQRSVALTRVKEQQQRWPNDPELYRREARLYADRDPLRYHAALGNAFYFEDRDTAALEQYQLAAAAPGDDFYLRSSLEARQRELAARIKADGKKAR
ncbi:M48 family metalloprotease [Crenobacter sp. SG2303]|uniref:M48 family metalloprotease n=1 Tax=Crenobacter oryzisoli TaxID=3056844 RepID=A0ABT7XLS3_9NEIS|nr:M48 family metalloprotease [Crenobacter sp. SG2303]MDN0074732.1 M48 family metalloprotease [Crenobacter sp. SG2303]